MFIQKVNVIYDITAVESQLTPALDNPQSGLPFAKAALPGSAHYGFTIQEND